MTYSMQDLEALYQRILLVRLCEQQIMKEYFKDEMKTPVHLGIGGEAISVGVHLACPPKTQFFGTYRNHALFLACSNDTDSFFGEMYGKANGCGKGKAGSMHMAYPEGGLIATSAVVATTIPVAAGAALAAQYSGEDKIAVVIFGDGAAEEGVFFETLNFASLRKLPLLFVCEDNELAIHSPKQDRKGFHSFESLSKAFDIEFASGNGADALDVLIKTKDIVARMKTSGKPGLLHFNYFRFLEHVGPLEDFDKGYRAKPDELNQRWDPLIRLRKVCIDKGLSASNLDQIEREILAKIDKSVALAKATPYPSANELMSDIFVQTSTETH